MNAYVSKPIDRTRLVAALRQCLPKSRFPVPAGASAGSNRPAPVAGDSSAASSLAGVADAPIDVSALLDRCVGDKTFVAKILDKFAQRVATDVDALRAAVEASDLAAVTRGAHTIKGSAANVSAIKLSAACDLLEKDARAGELATAPERLATIGRELDRFFDALEETLESLKA
jgi:HPt (histidine-containing phosphotransfer) domain-containing protein